MGTNHYNKRNMYSDEYLVGLYQKYGTCQKASEHCDCSWMTINRACKRSGIKLDGRKHNGYHGGNVCGGSPLKITDEELIEESKTMNGVQIAKRHGMDVGRVYKRAKKLGIYVQVDGNKWKHRSERYGCTEFDESITLERVMKKYNGICQICGQPVDVNDIHKGHIRKLYPTVDHIIPLSKGGTHTWGNVQLAHMYCNAGKRDKVS